MTQSFVFSFYSLLFFLLGIGRKSSREGKRKKERKGRSKERGGKKRRIEEKEKGRIDSTCITFL